MSPIPGCAWISANSCNTFQGITNAFMSSTTLVNPTLFNDKFVHWESLDFSMEMKSEHRLKRIDHLKRVAIKATPRLSEQEYQALRNRKNSLPGVVPFPLTTLTPLIVNLGSEAVLETSIALHRHYGFPIIPGSAIKGATRRYCSETNKDAEVIRNIFGGADGSDDKNEGAVIFLDAWPAKISQEFLYVDVMTPHYGEYYKPGSTTLPADSLSPNPIPFLAVKNDIRFEFALGLIARARREATGPELLQQASEFVREALGTIGIGAKTGSSYGYFH